ncbi:lymphocyte-specific protein 1 isoform X1 [Coturnix japonica]|uniref:Lymphocyte specific protein 1 n=1 Tax=Coturnix japonica TaxID=93934 RepID=A0A8C2U4M1_COTJA|nr:lymphocyte-specific protein 1 isoform X1 [Coturnix japonica]
MSDLEECQEGAVGTDQVGDESYQESERLTAQWSVEDEEEAARERRRREREKQLKSQAEEGFNGTGSCMESASSAQENHYGFKPSGNSELEEDEGFSDWSQKLEQRKQRSPQQSYEEEDSGVREVEVKLEQIQLDQEGPEEAQEENVVVREEERLCQEEEHVPEQHEEEEGVKQERKKRRRNEEENTLEKSPKAPSPISLDEEELSSDCTAASSIKITDRTESLNRSINKSNSIKRSQPPLPVSKIDDRLEQYTQAIETSTKTVRQPSLDLPTTSMMVARTKSLWETGEIAAQSAVKTSACKDIVAGDIVSKRSLWEQKGSPKPETGIKSAPSDKKYKFVATAHGQYKRINDTDETDDAAEQ